MHHPSVVQMALAGVVVALSLPTAAFAEDAWAIAPGQEAAIEHALTTNATWPKGWEFTGARIDHGVIDARYRNPAGVGLGVRLQHPQATQGERIAGPFEIANISADLPDEALTALKGQLAQVHDFKWTPLADRFGDNHDVLPGDPTQAQGAPRVPHTGVWPDPCADAPDRAACRQEIEQRGKLSRWMPVGTFLLMSVFLVWRSRRRKPQP